MDTLIIFIISLFVSGLNLTILNPALQEALSYLNTSTPYLSFITTLFMDGIPLVIFFGSGIWLAKKAFEERNQ